MEPLVINFFFKVLKVRNKTAPQNTNKISYRILNKS